jgi:hypothetical protein
MPLAEKNSSTDNFNLLLAKYLSGEADVNEIASVEAWLSENEANKKLLSQLQLIWNDAHKLDPANKKPDIQAALQKFQARIDAKTLPKYRLIGWKQVAAIFLLCGGLAIAIIKLQNRPANPIAGMMLKAGSHAELDTLPDGSVIRLQPNAELKYTSQFEKGLRQVQLSGNAFFSVAHDPDHPFEITINGVKVTVLGTSFEIADTAAGVKVTVFTGVVQVEKRGQSLKIYPHEHLFVPLENTAWKKQKDTLPGKLSSQTPPAYSQTISSTQDTPAHNYEYYHRQMGSILQDVVKEKLVTDKKEINWLAFTDSVFIINGVTQPKIIFHRFKDKFNIKHDEGYFYGPVEVTGKGNFFDSKDFNK